MRVFDVYTGAQLGEGRRSLALALSFRASDRTLSEEDVAPVPRADRRARWASLEVSFVAEPGACGAQPARDGARRVLVAGATGFAGALAAQLLWRHPGFELVGVTGRSEVGRRLDDLYPRYRVPLEIGELVARSRSRASMPRSSPTRMPRPRRRSGRCASAACASWT